MNNTLKVGAVPNFTARFVNNKNFKDTVAYAEKSGRLLELDSALNTLNNVNKADILIVHGNAPDGRVYSNFNVLGNGGRSIQNFGAESPEEATLNAIVELSELGRKFRKLFPTLKCNLNAEAIINKYSKRYDI